MTSLLFVLLLSVVLLTTVLETTVGAVGPADPNCETGIVGEGACCQKQCGQCGGRNCFTKSKRLGTRCCASGIKRPVNKSPLCADSGPPCILRTPSPSPKVLPKTDPTCSTGLVGNGACCRKSCERCGGPGCGQRGRRARTVCCQKRIKDISAGLPSCSQGLPPCRMDGGTVPAAKPSVSAQARPVPSKSSAPKPSPSSSSAAKPATGTETGGKWVHAPVNGGSLTARHEACAVMVDGKVVLVGGRGFRPVNVYDPVSRVWSRRKGYSGGQIHHFQCVAAGGSVWIIASWKLGFPREENHEHVFEYDVADDTWREHTALPEPRRRGGAASVVRGDWIYLVAGNRGGHGSHATALNWMDAFNWRTLTWAAQGSFPDMPGPGRDHVGGALVQDPNNPNNDLLCIAGGRNGGSARFFYSNIAQTYCYSFNSKSWKQYMDIPTPRAGAMTGTDCQNRLMIAGGEGDGNAYPNVDVFDGENWKRFPPLVRKRHGSGLAFAKCGPQCAHIFIPSGSGNMGGSPELPSTEEFIPNGSPINCAQY